MDTLSERSTHPTEDALVCYLEDTEKWRHRFPKAEICFASSAFCGFLIITGGVMVFLHYWLESRTDFHSMMEHLDVAMHIVGLSFLMLAGVIILSLLFTYAIVKIMTILEMAHKYKEHRELCAYEDLRQSFRSQSGFNSRCDGMAILDLKRLERETK